MNIRRVHFNDAASIAEIYNYYILNSHSTFETEEISPADMQNRIEYFNKNYPFLVAEKNAQILGYAYATQFKLRDAYKHSAEVSVYVRNGEHGRGIGKRIYKSLFDELFRKDFHALIAGIALPNEASIRLHENFGFEKVAHFREVGFKFGKWIDVGYWQLMNKK